MMNDVLQSIKARGYWRIHFRPLVATEKLKQLKDCREMVERNVVHLRGWDYPYFPRTGENCGSADNYFFTALKWEAMIEYWRMYKSGQFIHLFALREDWFDEDSWMDKGHAERYRNTLSVIGGCEYQLTEVFEFLSRLAKSGLYDEGVQVSISLHNTKGRKLIIDDNMRVPFHFDRKTQADQITVFEDKIDKQAAMIDSKELTIKAIFNTFERFDWYPDEKNVRADVEKFLSGKR